jgi:protein-disulfide isomerase
MPSPLIHRRAVAAGLLVPALAACARHVDINVKTPDDMSLGNPSAKVTVVEYASVACPVCGRWYKEVWPAFKAKYVDPGKIHFIYREMLVGGSDEVTIAASGFLLARCAGPDKYFQVVDLIYKSQPALFDQPRAQLLATAKAVGLSEDQFDTCVKNEAALQALTRRVDANSRIDNVSATPTFVVNRKVLEPGYHPLADLDEAIAAAQAGRA